MIQNGETDFKKPIGTGPFMANLHAGQVKSASRLNPNYWVTGKPYVEDAPRSSPSTTPPHG